MNQNTNSFISDFLLDANQKGAIEQYGLQCFNLNILDKRQTMIEKLVSLIRFSFSENPLLALASKIRHFYDLYFLANDPECAKYIQTYNFLKDFRGLVQHDQLVFD